MRHEAAAWGLALSLLFPAPNAAADRPSYNRRTGLLEVPLVGLREAAERGDRAELGRRAARIGVARLAKALADPDHRLALAARIQVFSTRGKYRARLRGARVGFWPLRLAGRIVQLSCA
jgi:hypothetical protein